MRGALVQAARQQFGFRCGYCDVTEAEAGATFTVDHFHPRKCGGTDDFANLVYCCHACNEHKGFYWNPGAVDRILHPIRDDLPAHYTETDAGMLDALTDTGRFHVARLHLNRPGLVRNRQVRRETQQDRRNRAAVVDTLGRVEDLLKALRTAIESIRAGANRNPQKIIPTPACKYTGFPAIIEAWQSCRLTPPFARRVFP